MVAFYLDATISAAFLRGGIVIDIRRTLAVAGLAGSVGTGIIPAAAASADSSQSSTAVTSISTITDVAVGGGSSVAGDQAPPANNPAIDDTVFTKALTTELKARRISTKDIDYQTTKNAAGKLKSLVVMTPKDDVDLKRKVAAAAIAVLERRKIDTSGMKSIPNSNSAFSQGWNVVYKDGGWVVNGARAKEQAE